MEKVREDFDHIKRALDEMLYYNPEELERQADEYERDMARKEGRIEGIKEGREEGIKEGIKQGKEEKLKKLVLNLYKNKVSIEKISKYTNLTLQEINNLLNID